MEENKISYFNRTLKQKQLTIVCAESITAGLLSSTIASISGSSEILKGSIVTYSRELKSCILGVDPKIIDLNTAESIETTVEMTYGLYKLYPSADIFVSVTGVASPSNDNYKVNKQVGQIYVAVYFKNKMHTLDTVIEETDRNSIRIKAVESIFNFILTIV